MLGKVELPQGFGGAGHVWVPQGKVERGGRWKTAVGHGEGAERSKYESNRCFWSRKGWFRV